MTIAQSRFIIYLVGVIVGTSLGEFAAHFDPPFRSLGEMLPVALNLGIGLLATVIILVANKENHG